MEHSIGLWFSAETIRRWVASFDGFKAYSERVVLLLYDEQKQEHLKFAKALLEQLGIGERGIISGGVWWKLVLGLVTRIGAKACKELGVKEKAFQAYHKKHIKNWSQ